LYRPSAEGSARAIPKTPKVKLAKTQRDERTKPDRPTGGYGRDEFLRDICQPAGCNPAAFSINGCRTIVSTTMTTEPNSRYRWWWLTVDPKRVNWPEMKMALDALREADINPHGRQVFSLYVQNSSDNLEKEELAHWEILERALRDAEDRIPDRVGGSEVRSMAKIFLGAFLEQLKPQLERARIGVPPSQSYRPKDVPLHRAMYLWREGFKIPSEEGRGKTKPLCGKPASLAAALVLLGIEPMELEAEPGKPRPFEKVVRKVKAAYKRYAK
jgi:hypothetical protein